MYDYRFLIMWAVLLVIAIVAETVTQELVAIWFMPAIVINCILAYFQVDLYIQIMVFIFLSAVLLITTRRWAKRILSPGKQPTNADRVVGETGTVIQRVSALDATGQVKVMGQIWSARSEDPERILEENAVVRVVRIEGVHVVVSPCQETAAENA